MASTQDSHTNPVAELSSLISQMAAMLERAKGILLSNPDTLASSATSQCVSRRLNSIDTMTTASELAALGSPIRLEILAICAEGPIKVRDLAARLGKGTTGQVYHHLRQLSSAGWLRPEGKSGYVLNERRAAALGLILDALAKFR